MHANKDFSIKENSTPQCDKKSCNKQPFGISHNTTNIYSTSFHTTINSQFIATQRRRLPSDNSGNFWRSRNTRDTESWHIARSLISCIVPILKLWASRTKPSIITMHPWWEGRISSWTALHQVDQISQTMVTKVKSQRFLTCLLYETCWACNTKLK